MKQVLFQRTLGKAKQILICTARITNARQRGYVMVPASGSISEVCLP